MARDGTGEAQTLQRQVGARIRALRAAVGQNQDDFADTVGLHRSYVGQLENGHKDVRLSTLERITAACGVSLLQLLDPAVSLDEVIRKP